MMAVTDEVYEHIIYDGCQHLSIASARDGRAYRDGEQLLQELWRDRMARRLDDRARDRERYSKSARLPDRRGGGAAAGGRGDGARFPRTYYTELGTMYQEKRDTLLEMLRSAGFTCVTPSGAYYIMADIGHSVSSDDFAAADFHAQGGRRRGRTRFELLSSSGAGAPDAVIYLLQERRDDRGRGRAAGFAGTKDRRARPLKRKYSAFHRRERRGTRMVLRGVPERQSLGEKAPADEDVRKQ